MIDPVNLSLFRRRVRWVRAWRGAAVGLCLGAGFSAGWAGLDLASLAYTEWSWMAIATMMGALVGGIVGSARSIPPKSLAQSIDRRARLEDRLASANERVSSLASGEGPFDASLRVDAEAHLRNVNPRTIYPFRLSAWHGGTVAFAALAAAIFLLGNTPLFLNDQAKKGREAMHKEGEKVERVIREVLDPPEAKAQMSDAERRLAEEIRKYQRDLEKAHISPEEAMQKANEIAQKADELMRQSAKQTESSLNDAQSAMQQMQRDQLAKSGMTNANPQRVAMSPMERKQRQQDAEKARSDAQKKVDSLQSQLDEINKKLKNPNLSAAERQALERQKRELEKQLSDARESRAKAESDLAELKLSKEASDVLSRMQQNPLYWQMQELAKKLRADAKSVDQTGRPRISDAERKEMQKEFDKLVAALKDDKNMDAYLQAMKEAMEHASGIGRDSKLGFSLPIPMPGTGGPGNSIMIQDIGQVNHSDRALNSEGSTAPTMVVGQARPGLGDMPYVEIKAPATMGNRSSVPYAKVFPSYRKKAESALDRQEIPKEQEKRVKAYFESLGH